MHSSDYGIEIISTGQSLPQKSLDNFELSTMMDTSDEWIVTRTGIKSRRICTDETCNSLALEAARQAIERAKSIESEIENKIKFLIVCTLTPDNVIPSTACLVKEALGLPDQVMSFDLNAACSGFVYGLTVMKGLLGSMPDAYGLLIGSEQLSKVMDYTTRSRGTTILFGDGAGAAIMKASFDPNRLFYYGAWSHGDHDALYCPGATEDDVYVRMDGAKIFRFAVAAFEEGIEYVLKASGLTMDDVDMVVCHQANIRIIDHVKKKYADNADKFYVNIEDHGNTSAASVPIAFDDLYSKGVVTSGMKVLCVAVGAGITWSSVLFTV